MKHPISALPWGGFRRRWLTWPAIFLCIKSWLPFLGVEVTSIWMNDTYSRESWNASFIGGGRQLNRAWRNFSFLNALTWPHHPFTRTSRQKGNRTMTLTLVGRFQARPGGYITTKNEDTMHSLGLVSKKSKLAGRTSMEFCVRLLGKAAEFVQNKVAAGLRTLNFCLDAAMVGEESVTWHTDVLGWFQSMKWYM